MESAKLNWKLKVFDISKLTNVFIQEKSIVVDTIVSGALANVTFDTTLGVLAQFDSEQDALKKTLIFLQHVSVDGEVRNASSEAEKKINNLNIEIEMREDLYSIISRLDPNDPSLRPEQARLLRKRLLEGKKNGLLLPENEREEVKEIKKRISELSIEFVKNMNMESTKFEFTDDELAGMSNTFLSYLDKTEIGKRVVTLKYPHYFPLMRQCEVEETRKKVCTAFDSRCKNENSKLLRNILKLRYQLAKVLGYNTWADYVLDGESMAQNAINVKSFLEDLTLKIKPQGEEELDTLKWLKNADSSTPLIANNESDQNRILAYDFFYYKNKYNRDTFKINEEEYQQYFPFNTVLDGICSIYQELLSLKLSKISEAEVWHPDVLCYEVTDLNTLAVLGYFYLDLFSREGKFGHACCMSLQSSCYGAKYSQKAYAAMLANFTVPMNELPSLLTHNEVVVFFHEFGHVLHVLCTRTELVYFSGMCVDMDFLETPSQMLENWCWNKEGLKRLSGHYETGEPLPDVMIEKLIDSRYSMDCLFTLRQLSLSTLDFVLHTNPECDLSVYDSIVNDIFGIPSLPNTCMPASFLHLALGYDSRYYGYLWSEVFAQDMFATRFEQEGIFSRTVGGEYRKYILEPGGSLDSIVLLKNFLGREPNSNAYLKSKGLE